MSRKKKTTDTTLPADISTATAEPSPTANDTPQAAIDNQPSFAERVGHANRPAAADPFAIAVDTVAGVRLFESKRDRQMALKFDEKPGQAVIDRLKEAGYHWNPDDRIWAQAVWPASAMSTRIRAERLYQEVSEMIRKDKGIDTGPDIPF